MSMLQWTTWDPHLVWLLSGVVSRGQQHVGQGRTGGCICGRGWTRASSLQQSLMSAPPVDLWASFLGRITSGPRLVAAALQAGASLHHRRTSDLLQNTAQSCGRGGSSRVVRIQRQGQGGGSVPHFWPYIGGFGGRGAHAGHGGVMWGNGGASALWLEELLQAMAQRSHVLQGIVGDFGQAVLWLRCPPADLRIHSASCIRLLWALLATTLIHQRPPVSRWGSTWGLQETSYAPLTPPSERLSESREAEGTALSWAFWVDMHLWLGSMSCLSTTKRKIKWIKTCSTEEHKNQKHSVKQK